MKKSLVTFVLSYFCFLVSVQSSLAVQPSDVFGDHMVLQRGMAVPLWGKAEPGERVTVVFGGHAVETIAEPSGRWMVRLPAMEASADGRELTIAGDQSDADVVIRDVLIGEVWVCSGQSNMQYGWGKEGQKMFAWGGDKGLAKLVPDARAKPIRSFDVLANASFEPIDELKGAWKADVPGSAVAMGFSYYLQRKLDVPVGVIVTCWGSTFIEGWMPRDMVDVLPSFKERLETFDESERAQKRVKHALGLGVRPGFVFVRKQPNIVYNAMMHPLLPYAARGIVWYQGEANAKEPGDYAKSLPAWIKRMRQGFENDELHFLGVMLPGYGEDDGHPTRKSWALFREAQLAAELLDDAHVINTIDLGDVKNIHPPDKQPIAERLALMAAKKVYGKAVVASGPRFVSYQRDGEKLTISFDHAEGLKTMDGKPPRGFWVNLGGDWFPPEATIVDDTVELIAPQGERVNAIYYGWSGKPDVNLVNAAGLPAYPFRTDGVDE